MQPFTNALFEYTLQDDKSYLLLEEISPEINSPVICIHIEHGQSRYWKSIVIIPLLYLPIPSLSFKPRGRHFNCPNSFALRIFNPLDWFMWRENFADLALHIIYYPCSIDSDKGKHIIYQITIQIRQIS